MISRPSSPICAAGVGRTKLSPTRSGPEGSSRNDFASGRSGSHPPPLKLRRASRSFSGGGAPKPWRRRAGGGPLDAWKKGKATEFRELYAFDPTTETVERLADAPTALYASHLAYDRKRELFFTVAVFDKGEQPSGMFAYDPSKDA